jgi:CAAX protease family protein
VVTTSDHSTDMLAVGHTWRERGIALTKVVMFFILSQSVFHMGVRVLHPKIDLSATGKIGGFLYLELIQLACAVIIPLGLLLFAFGEPLKLAGWSRPLQVRQFFLGLATGLVAIAAVVGVLALLGDYSAGSLLLSAGQIVKYGGAYVVTMLLVALGEESIFRGYGLMQLSRAISFWPAAVLSSFAFGAEHLANVGMTLIGGTSVALAGLMLAYSLKRTGALYFACGFHAAWDGGSTFLFGVIAVGLRLPDTLFRAQIRGPGWLTGGSAGPIGGVLGIAAFLLAIVVVWACLSRGGTGATASTSARSET